MSSGSSSDIRSLIAGMSDEEIDELVASLPQAAAIELVSELGARVTTEDYAEPIDLAIALDPGFRRRGHLEYLSARLGAAVADVEAGRSRKLIVEMPPRSGKTTLTTQVTPAWILSKHPDWSTVLVSHDSTLATSWGRQIRRWAEGGSLPFAVAPDAGAVSEWETTEGGSLVSRSVRSSLTGRGARVMIIDDPVKDFVDAQSETTRQAIWDWWLTVALTRLEGPYLVVVVMTRWHEDDLVGRLLSTEHEGDPSEWERITFPALADPETASPPVDADGRDVLGRAAGEPLLSPLIVETPMEAAERWAATARSVGTYTFSALYQQRPSPAEGTIFMTGRLRYWTRDPGRATDDGRIVYLDPAVAAGGAWVDSWDFAFGRLPRSNAERAKAQGSWVVGQRWVRVGANRFLVAQRRERLSFTGMIAAMKAWAEPGDALHPTSPFGQYVRRRLVEAKANGVAIIETLHDSISGIIPITPSTSKEARARAQTPEVEAGNVYVPLPAEPGNEWVTRDLIPELRDFPRAAHDDQVDAFTQALADLHAPARAGITVPRSATPSGPTAGVASARIPARALTGRPGLGGARIPGR